MFGSSAAPATPGKEEEDTPTERTVTADEMKAPTGGSATTEGNNGGEKRSSSGVSPGRKSTDDGSQGSDKKRRSSGVSRAKDMLSSAKQSLHFHGSSTTAPEKNNLSPMQKLGMSDPALSVPQGSLNNSAGESLPGPRSTFRVGVTEDRNKKCRRTMEDTHAYLYNFLSTPAPVLNADQTAKSKPMASDAEALSHQVAETDNGYFAIFDGHAGTFAADWCGKKLHILLEDTIRKNPNTPIPELLDQTFTLVDQQLEKLPLKNSGCTAVIAVLRWEDRVPSSQSVTGSAFFAPVAAAAAKNASKSHATLAEVSTSGSGDNTPVPQSSADTQPLHPSAARIKESATRQRVLYTANVGDARIVLCRNGKALRLSYDHKGSDEHEGRRVANAGGLILNNRVNGVLAVTRALGDAYMKDLVTGHPYTTETVIQEDEDEFLILACDGLWDVCSDQEAVDLVRNIQDPQAASKQLVDHALARFSTDNLSCMIVRFDNKAIKQRRAEAAIGVEGDQLSSTGAISEADAIVSQAKKHLDESGDASDKGQTDSIIEEEEGEPVPELNPDAPIAARKNP